MARFSIISKDGNKIRYEGKPRYIGTYLKPSYLEFSEIASSTPIDWQVGDYIDYPRTGMRYRLYSIPQASKNARKGSHGRAFTYSNVQLHAATKELEIALFKDLVSADNNIHFSTSPDVATFEDVYGIARRIQACMDDLYPNRWVIEVADFNAVEDAEMLENITTAKDFALSGGTCLDALTKIYELWQEVGWIHTYDSASGKDVITIGYANKRIGANTTEAYIYGKGNGLTAIKKTQANKDEFATRLYIYGSDRNLPSRYYNGKYILNAESVDIRNLMIPIGQWKTTGGVPDARKAYLENAEAVAKYGVIPKTHYFDSDDAGADIYPTIEGITIGQVRRLQADYKPSTSIYPNDGERIDEVKSSVNPSDDGVIRPLGKAYKYYRIENIESQSEDITLEESTTFKDTKILLLTDLDGEGKVDMTVIPDIKVTLEDAGFTEVNVTFELTDSPTKMKTVSKLSSVVAKKNEVTGEWEFKAPRMSVDYDFASNGSIPVCYIMTIDATLEKAKKGEIITLSISEGEIEVGANALLDKEFTITLKQIGFNIEERASIGSGKTISMKSGDNEGRNFIIKECRYNASSDSWVLTCKRQQDNNLGMLFPNKDYQIMENDRFVLLDIAMPELYLSAAMERLFVEGQKLLSKVSRIQNNYEPSIDAVVMAESGRTIREGMFMQISDEDIMDGTTEYILIDTINIYEDEAAIPTYKVTLKEKKKVSYKGTPSATTTSNTNPVEEKTDVDLSGYVTKEQFAAVEMLKDLFYKHDNETYGTKYNLFSEGEMSANGLNLGGGTSGGGGLIQNVLGKGAFGTVASEDNTTTFNAYAIDSLYKRIVELEGKDVEVDLSDYYTKQQTQNAITDALSPYIKATDADGKYAALASFNALQSSFDRLYSALNDDTSGVINTWNEVVDFVNEYSGSEDLSTILGKMNTDINARVKVSDFDTWKTDVFNPLSVTVTNLGNKVDTNTANINKLLGWFNVDADGNLFTTLNFYSTKEISANGISQGTGGGGSGLISSVLSATSLGATLTNDNSVVFNAYATNEIYKATQGHASRIGVLESQVGQLTTQGTKVSVSDLLTTGTKIATITVDGVAHEVKGDFLPTSGGEIKGDARVVGYLTTDKNRIRLGSYYMLVSNDEWMVTDANWQHQYSLLHTGNYSQYALPLTGGTITDLLSLQYANPRIVFKSDANTTIGAFGYIDGYLQWFDAINLKYNKILHTGNYSDYALPKSGGTITPTTTTSTPLVITSSTTSAAIRLRNTLIGSYIGVNSLGNWFVTDNIWASEYPLIHSGNVGEYAFVPRTVVTNNTDANTLLTNGVYINSTGNGIGNVNFPHGYGMFMSFAKNDDYIAQIALGTSSMYARTKFGTSGWSDWKTIAFTDSNVASAYKLITTAGADALLAETGAVTIPNAWQIRSVNGAGNGYVTMLLVNSANDIVYGYGGNKAYHRASSYNFTVGTASTTAMLINSSGNVLIGTTDDNGAKLGVGGDVVIPNNFSYKILDTAGTARRVIQLNSANGLLIGQHTAANAYSTNLYGYAISLVCGTANKLTMLLNSSGNVTIGGSDLAGTNVKLYVDGHIRLGATGYLYKGENTVIDFTAAGAPLFGYGSANAGLDTRLSGKNVYITYGGASTFGLILNSSGNVTVGSSDLAGTSAKLYVDGVINTTDNINIYGGYLSLRPATSVYGDIKMTSSYMRFQALHDGVAYLPISLNPNGGNILIGTTDDDGSGAKLQVAGNASIAAAIYLTRDAGPNYIWANKAGSIIALGVQDAGSHGTASASLLITASTLFPGYRSGVVSLGSASYRWSTFYGVNGDFSNAVTVSGTLTIAGATTHNGIAYFGGTTYYINTSGNANFNAISGDSLSVTTLTVSGASSFASKTTHNGGIGTAWISVSGESTFTGKTTHNGGIGTTTVTATDIETEDFLATGDAQIYGSLRLQKGANASGNYLYFGDGSFCYLHEEADDRLTIYAQKGLVTKAATGIAWDSITDTNWMDDNSAHTRFVNNYNALAIIIDKDYGASYRRAAIQVGDTSNLVGTLYLNPKGGEVHIASSGVDTYVKSSLHVGSILYASTIYAGSTLYLQASTITNQAEWWSLDATGNFYTLGNIAAEGEISANALNQGSDIRFKHQLGDIIIDLDTIANAPMFRFTWTNKENSRVQIGTSAQYWKDSARELVSVDKDDFHRLDYATLGVLIGVTLGKTVKNHEDRIKELEKEVVELKEENRRLRYEC